ncbi:hypothetical protein BZG25_00135 [Salinivibrio sp. ML198]|uniref:hypothetical protein n=1 Tax=Salinivibrio sp. ML198 TaxID=1909458 RepID=UPI000989488E|nr:hypothetical protein [Salinivibrio sp. ML198]OOE82305.1 hypothetical protein BZG25_00135 [Salinivibrio sp. ML198]
MTNEITESPIKVVQFSRKNFIAQVVIGGLMIAAGIALNVFVAALGGLSFILMSVANNSIDHLRFYQDRMEIKLLALRSRDTIFNKDISDVQVESNVVILTVKESEKQKKIPLGYFSEEDKKEIVAYCEGIKNDALRG